MGQVRRYRQNQSGVSLVEMLVVLALVSGIVLVLALGLQTVVTTDGRTNRKQRNNLALTSVTEALRRNDVSYQVCCPDSEICNFDGAASLADRYEERALDKLGDGDAEIPDFQVTEVAYWQAGDFATPPSTEGGKFSTTCIPDATALRLSVEVSLSGETLRGQVVKRKPLPGESTGAG
jgi:prepilin-type N-terminal cleavage/methylation domain-containing protein